MTEGSGGGSHAPGQDLAGRASMAGRSRRVSAGELTLRIVAGLLALFLGLPVVVLVVRSVRRGVRGAPFDQAGRRSAARELIGFLA